MPLYEYRCEVCEGRFELRRSAGESDAPVTCPEGHPGARRLFSVFAMAGRSATVASSATTGTGPSGGCCGGGCCSAH